MANTYAITGATGNIGGQMTEKLLGEGHNVRAIARTAEKLQSLAEKGAEARSGSVEDTAFLTEAYRGVDGVFAMTPPDFQSDDYRAFQIKAAKSHVAAIKGSGVKNVVALSSVGAHLTEGAGIVQGLHDFEQHLSELNDVNVLDKDDLKYVQFPYDDARQSMVQMGLTENVANLLIGLTKAINSGDILSHYQRTPENTTETSIEEFAQGFAAAYKAQQ